jgi:hypothetical protein
MFKIRANYVNKKQNLTTPQIVQVDENEPEVDYVVNEETGEIQEVVKAKVQATNVINVQPIPNKKPQSTLTGGVRVSQGGRNKGSAKNLNESFM